MSMTMSLPQALAPPSGIATSEPILSDEERDELAACERVIERGYQTFVEVGQALLRIQKGKLYRAEFPNFERYLRERWHFSRGHGYHLIYAARAVEALASDPEPHPVLPETFAAVQSLIGRQPEDQRAIWRAAVATAPPGKIRGKHVTATRARLEAPPPQTRAKPPPPSPDTRPAAQQDRQQAREATRVPSCPDDEDAQETPLLPVAAAAPSVPSLLRLQVARELEESRAVPMLLDAIADAVESGWQPARRIQRRTTVDTLLALVDWIRSQARVARAVRAEPG